MVPPYLPTPSMPSSTTGFFGRRWSTGGSLPWPTRSASIGASVYLPGAAAAGGAVAASAAGAVAASAGTAVAAAAGTAVGGAAGGVVGGAAGDVGATTGAGGSPPQAASPAPAVSTAENRRNWRRLIVC